ncbi:MAG: glycosyltransferase family 4 protein [bacterium]|nr:glycosyltransferase family 4 protein [bacterium]MDZ4232049.1 glycosyltransferase family 4 protein [Candidatus Pacearchaeota archaeon]
MKKIGWIEVSRKRYGGVLYNEEARKALSEKFEVQVVSCEPRILAGFRRVKFFEVFLRLFRLEGEMDVWVRDHFSLLTLSLDRTRGKNIVLIHHFDFSALPFPGNLVFSFLKKLVLYRNLRKADVVVTVSQYWQKHFSERGCRNVHLIYNGFDLRDFEISEEEVKEFKKRFDLEGNPIVYLGNCQKAKGVVGAYTELKGMDVHLVTSGVPQLRLKGTRNLDLEHRDYLKLLKASSLVVAMSKFEEGWSRTVHEAMLVETPVIGSGKGGMRELLLGGEQMVCSDIQKLRNMAESVLRDPILQDTMGKRGYAFASKFTLERFSSSWIQLIDSL